MYIYVFENLRSRGRSASDKYTNISIRSVCQVQNIIDF